MSVSLHIRHELITGQVLEGYQALPHTLQPAFCWSAADCGLADSAEMFYTLHHAVCCVFIITSEGTSVCVFNIAEVVSTLAKIAIFCFMLESKSQSKSKSHQTLQSRPSQPQRRRQVRQNFLSNVLLMVWLGVVFLPVASAECEIQPDANGQVTIPASQTSIGGRAFYECSSLKTVVFESGSQIQTIGEYAFQQSDLSGTITIPPSVTSIGLSAFNPCSSLTGVVFDSGSQLQTIGDFAFY